MANSVLRRGYGFLVAENSFAGSVGDNPVFYIPAVELTMTPVVGYAENTSMMGSSYEADDARPDRLMANLEITMKLNEDVFPLLLLNKYDIATSLVVGETDVYQHIASYNGRNEGTSYKFVFIDQDRTDEQYNGVIFSALNFTVEPNAYVTVQATARANFPIATSITGTISTTGEFVSRNLRFQMVDFGSSLAGFPVTAFTASHAFGEPEETDEMGLGEYNRTVGLTTSDRFTIEATALLPDYTLRNKWRDGQRFASLFEFEDLTRFVSGSVASTRPSVSFNIPSAKVIEWSNEGGANDIRKQSFTLLALNTAGVSNTPHQITIVNAVDEYLTTSSS